MEDFVPIRLKKNDNPLWKALVRLGRKRKIEFYEFNKIKGLKGFCVWHKGDKAIFINTDILDSEFKCHVLAHELGHAVLHAGVCNRDLYFNDKEYSTTIENEANKFADKLIRLLKRKLQAGEKK